MKIVNNCRKQLNKIMFKEMKGFSGVTHMLIATFLFQLIWILPIFSMYISQVKAKDTVTIILFWGILIGASLLPDLDNNVSTAKYQLGIIGRILSMFMVMVSSMVYSIFHTKNDKCKSQHRMLWHTLFIYMAELVIIYFFHPTNDYTILEIVKSKMSIMNNSAALIAILFFFLSCCSIYLFINFICYYGGKIISWKVFNVIKIVLSLACFVFLGSRVSLGYLKFISYAVCIGSMFHNIGDLFSLGSVPVFFPVPIKKQLWLKPKLPFQLETGGVANRVLNFVLLIVVVTLFLCIFGYISLEGLKI